MEHSEKPHPQRINTASFPSILYDFRIFGKGVSFRLTRCCAMEGHSAGYGAD